MARYLKGSLNNNWDRDQDRYTRPVATIDSYFGSMTDERLRSYIASATAQLAQRRDACMAGNVRDAQAELDRRGITEVLKSA